MNNNLRQQIQAAAFSALLAGGLGAAFAASAGDLQSQVDAAARPVAEGPSLAGVVVTGSGDAFLRSDQRLALLSASLPLDAKDSAAQQSGLRRVAGLFPRSPDAAAGEARRMMERGHTLPSGPDADGDVALGE